MFGIAWICPVKILESIDFEDIKQAVADFVDNKYPDKNITFKVEAKEKIRNILYFTTDMCSDWSSSTKPVSRYESRRS